MERVRPGGLCGAVVVADVPLPARAHRRLPEAHASEGLYITTAKYVQLSRYSNISSN